MDYAGQNKDIQGEWYQVGRVIYCGYWRSYDLVLAFNRNCAWDWSVCVQSCDKDGIPLSGTIPRWHSTGKAKGDKIVKENVAVALTK